MDIITQLKVLLKTQLKSRLGSLLFLPFVLGLGPARLVESPGSAAHTSALISKMDSDHPIQFEEYLHSLVREGFKLENNSLLRLLDKTRDKDKSPVYIDILLAYLRETRPELKLEKYFDFSEDDRSNRGIFTLEGTQMALNELQPKMKDQSVRFLTTADLKKTLTSSMNLAENQKLGIVFNYRSAEDPELQKSLHTSLFYFDRNGKKCNAIFLDSVENVHYQEFWTEVVELGALRDCKVRFLFTSRQMDSYACASYCIHDFLNIQKMDTSLFASLEKMEDLGVYAGNHKIGNTNCAVHPVLPASFMSLAQSFTRAIDPYLEALNSDPNEIMGTKKEALSFKNKIARNRRVFSGEHLSDSEWEALAASFPRLTELYYNRTTPKELNVKSKNVYTKYTSLILKNLLAKEVTE